LAGFKTISKLATGYEAIRKAIKAAVTPFGNTTPARKRKRRQRALVNLKFFAETYFPHYLTEAPSIMHLSLYKKYQKLLLCSEKKNKGAKDIEAAPRGNAKSTLTSLILPLWCIAGERRRFIALVSETTEQAEEFLEFIKAELDSNERLREDFPQACGTGRTWKLGQIVTHNGIKVKCWGKRKRMRGARHGNRRPDLVICDDLEGDENIDSPQQREKDQQWFFKALMKMGGRYTVYLAVGTILHHDSLIAKLLKRPGWTGKKWKAVIRWSPSQLWERWEKIFSAPPVDDSIRAVKTPEQKADAFFRRHKNEMLENTEVLWPEVEDYYYLMKMRISDGPAYFDSEKQNEPVNPDDCLFRQKWFSFWDREDSAHPITPGDQEMVYCAVDPSLGKQSRGADPSAIIVAVVRENGFIDVLEADIRKRHPDVIIEDLFRLHKKYPFARLGIEEVQFQELFKDLVIKESADRKIYLPVEGIRPHTDKVLRISKMQPHIKNGTIRFRRDQAILLDQLRYFPRADHDDGPDALEMLFSMVTRASYGPRIRRLVA